MSEYGKTFDDLVRRWSVIENEHDRHHPDRGECGGVGGCSMMLAAVGLTQEMIEALTEWRRTARLEAAEPESFRDGSGDWWERREDGRYKHGQQTLPLHRIREIWGEWSE